MLAAQLTKYGGENAINVNEIDKPAIDGEQILIKITAAGVNPFDVMVREGYVRSMAELSLPATLGGDFAGIVEAVGNKVSSFKTGDKVFGQAGALSANGSFAEYAPIKAGQSAVIPKEADMVKYAAMPLAAVSALQALETHMQLKPGQKILIHGAAGGIGSFAVQLAKAMKAYVIATCSTEDIDFVQQLGADEIIDYKTQDFTELVNQVDAVFDTVGGETNSKSYQVIKDGGAFVSMKDQPDEERVTAKNLNYVAQFTTITTKKLNKISELYEAGRLKPQIDKVFELNEAAKALEYQKTGHHKGKVVIKVAN